MSNENTTNDADLENAAKALATEGVAAKSTSVDGISVSQTMMDAMKPLDVADRLAARKAAKRPTSQIRFVKIQD